MQQPPLNASEISEIIKQRIDSVDTRAEVRNEGTVRGGIDQQLRLLFDWLQIQRPVGMKRGRRRSNQADLRFVHRDLGRGGWRRVLLPDLVLFGVETQYAGPQEGKSCRS